MRVKVGAVERFLASASFLTLLGTCAVFFTALTLASLLGGFAMERAAFRRGRRIFDVPLAAGQLGREALGTVFFLLVFVPAMAGVLASGVLHFAHGPAAQVLSFLVPLLGFQVFYYFLHRAMHHRRLFWMHRHHHLSRVTTPLTGLSMHPVEALGWTVGFVLPALALSSLGLLGLDGWLCFFGFHFFGNISGHANAEVFPLTTTRVSSFSANAVVYHSLHHARFHGHYGFATATMDVVFGTEFDDWLELHQRVVSGQPLRSLRERGGSAPLAPSPPERA